MAFFAGGLACFFYFLAFAVLLGSAMTGEIYQVGTIVSIAFLLLIATSALMAARTAGEQDREWDGSDRD